MMDAIHSLCVHACMHEETYTQQHLCVCQRCLRAVFDTTLVSATHQCRSIL